MQTLLSFFNCMKKINFKQIILLFLTLFYFGSVFGQNELNNPNIVFDRFGNTYSQAEIQVNETKEAVIAGLFELHFDGTLSPDKKEVMKQVFIDLSYLVRPDAILPYGNTGKVNIQILDPDLNMPDNALAGATPYFFEFGTGLTSGSVWEYINTGSDPLANIGLGNNNHGFMMVRDTPLDGYTWFVGKSELDDVGATEYDFYTVILHEAMHMLGFYSTILEDGKSSLTHWFASGESSMYSMFDLHLYQNGTKVIDEGTCYDMTYNNTLNLVEACGNLRFVFDHTNLSDNEIIYTNEEYQSGSSNSHFLCGTDLEYLMTVESTLGNKCRYPHLQEVRVLQSIGYEISWVYGSDAHSDTKHDYGAQTFPYNVIAGANDIKNPDDSYIYDIDFGGQIEINIADIIANDYSINGITGIECPEIVIGGYDDLIEWTDLSSAGSLTFTSGTLFSGNAYIKYRPVNTETGQKGNMAYIVVHISDPPLPTCNVGDCNLICGGDFEEFSESNVFTIGDFRPSSNQNTPDFLIRNEPYSGVGIHTARMIKRGSIGDYLCEYDGSSDLGWENRFKTFDNNPGRWLSMSANEESIYLPLNRTMSIDETTSYKLKIWIKASNYGGDSFYIYGSSQKPFKQCTNVVSKLNPLVVEESESEDVIFAPILLEEIIFPANSDWSLFEITLTNSPELDTYTNTYGEIQYLIFSKEYGLVVEIDNIELYEETQEQIEVSAVASDNTPCVGSIFTISYTFTVPEGNPIPGDDIIFEYFRPANIIVESGLDYNEGTDQYTHTVSFDGEQTYTFDVLLRVTGNPGEEIFNQGAIVSSNVCSNYTSNNTVTVTPIENDNALELDITSDYQSCNSQIAYTVTITNLTDIDYDNIILQSILPDDVNYLSSVTFTETATNQIEYTISTLPANGTIVLTFNTYLNDLSEHDNIIRVKSISEACDLYSSFLTKIVPLPDVTFATIDDICVDEDIIELTQGSPNGGTYTGIGITTSPIFDPVIAGVGIHEITYTYTDVNGCTNTATQNITVNPSPTATLTADITYICEGDLITFTAGGGDDYEFLLNNITVQNSNSNTYTSTTLLNEDVITVIVTESINNCSNTSAPVTINTFPNPEEVDMQITSNYTPGATQATYTVTLENLTDADYNNIALQSVLPADVTFTGSVTFTETATNQIQYTIPTLLAGEIIALTFTVDIVDFTEHSFEVCIESISQACGLYSCNTTEISSGLNKYLFTVEETLKCQGDEIWYRLDNSDIGITYFLINSENYSVTYHTSTIEGSFYFDWYSNEEDTYHVIASLGITGQETQMDGVRTVSNIPYPNETPLLTTSVCEGENGTITLTNPEEGVSYYTEDGYIFIDGVCEAPAGEYTIIATNGTCETVFTQTAIINSISIPMDFNINTSSTWATGSNNIVLLENTNDDYSYTINIGSYQQTQTGTGGNLVFNIDINELDAGSYNISVSVEDLIHGCTESITTTQICVVPGECIEEYEITGNVYYSSGNFLANNDIIVRNGAKLSFSHSNVIFDENASIIVEPGGQLFIDGSYFTGACGKYWKGIEVWGNPQLPQNSSNQGVLYINIHKDDEMWTTVIENADIGILVGSSQLRHHGGGIVVINNINLENNIRGIVFHPYRNFASNNPKVTFPNISNIRNINFTTDEIMYKADIKPISFMILNGVSGLIINNCNFENTAYNLFNEDSRGDGIQMTGTNAYVNNNNFKNLTFGIITKGIGDLKGFSISENEFSNNKTSCYVSNTTAAYIVSNQFIMQRDGNTGLQLVSSLDFQIENNIFRGGYEGLKIKTIGILPEYNVGKDRIYRNVFDNLGYAVLVSSKTYNPDLRIECNTFINNRFDVYNNSKKGLSEHQNHGEYLVGYLDAGNTFDSDCNYFGDYSDFYSQQTIYYYTRKIPEYIPNCHNENVSLIMHKGIYTNECPSKVNQTISLSDFVNMEELQLSIVLKNGQLHENTDGGNTDELLDLLINAHPKQTQELRDLMIELSPWLSDTILTYSVHLNRIFPTPVLREIFVNNPRTAKAVGIQKALNNRTPNMPQHMRDEIFEAGKDTLSLKENLEAEISGIQSEREQIISRRVRHYLADTLGTSTDSLIDLLNNEENILRSYQLVELYFSEKNADMAMQVFNSIPYNYELTEQELTEHILLAEFYQIKSDLISKDSTWSSASQSQLVTIENLANDLPSKAREHARGVLTLLYGNVYMPEIEYPEIEGTNKNAMIQDEIKDLRGREANKELISDKEFTIFPNPANGILNITLTNKNLTGLEDLSGLSSHICIYDITGKEVMNIETTNQETQQIDVSPLAKGIYLIKIGIATKRFEVN